MIIGCTILLIAFCVVIHKNEIGTENFFLSLGAFVFWPAIASLIFGWYKWRKGKIWA